MGMRLAYVRPVLGQHLPFVGPVSGLCLTCGGHVSGRSDLGPVLGWCLVTWDGLAASWGSLGHSQDVLGASWEAFWEASEETSPGIGMRLAYV